MITVGRTVEWTITREGVQIGEMGTVIQIIPTTAGLPERAVVVNSGPGVTRVIATNDLTLAEWAEEVGAW